MAQVRTPRTRWVDEAFRALAAGGPDAVRVEPLAEALGVTKGGFYWHFKDRGALLEELLDTWEHTLVDRVIERVDAHGGDARTKLRYLFTLAADRQARDLLRAELAIRDWARRDPAVATRLRRVDNRRMDYLRALFGEFCGDVEARALIAMSLFVGHHFVRADHEGRARRDVIDEAMELLTR